ncbi:hypothetical protein EQP59_02815 [Ornithobacterium rhinotracheale]|nr:hypothetical protein [Ornithobacterium rhinotracheale]QAR30360.1 hypothetical protein EQP59_02815 [Ornithobacterium rhinotracheale]
MKNLLYILFLIFSITFGYAQEVVAQELQSTNVNYAIKGIKYDEKTKRIIIIGDAGAGKESDRGSGEDSQEVLPGGKDYTLTDAKGNVWAVDEEGNITNVGMQAKGGASTPQNTAGVDAKGNATTITAEGIRVTFKNSSDSKYAFDQPAKALNSDYKKLNGKVIPFKAVENKKTEPFIASVEITDNSISADSLIFKTSKGVPIDAKKVGNDYRLTLKGLYSYATEQVQAIIKQGDKYQVAGAFNLVHISPKTIKLNLVPTTGVSISRNQIQKVKDIYKKIAIDVDISVKEAFDITPYLVNGKLPSEDAFGDLSSYSPAQNKVIEAYKQQRGVDLAYYIFVTDRPSSNGQAGYMRLGGQFGFVYDQQARTIAHELGHGALRLEHPFKEFKNVAQGDMKTLMDYNASNTNPKTNTNTNTNPKTNTNFIYPDWKQVNDPKFKIYAFQGQSEGELANLQFTEIKFDDTKFVEIATENISIGCENVLLPSGRLVKFSSNELKKIKTIGLSDRELSHVIGVDGKKYNLSNRVETDTIEGSNDIEITKVYDAYKLVCFKCIETDENAKKIIKQTQNGEGIYTNVPQKYIIAEFTSTVECRDGIQIIAQDEEGNIICKTLSKDACENYRLQNKKEGSGRKKDIGTVERGNGKTSCKITIYGKTDTNGQTGYTVDVEFTGTPKNAKIKAQEQDLKDEIKRIAEEKLNQLGLEGKAGKTVQEKGSELGEFYVADMTGWEWVGEISELGNSVWETAALPKSYWNEDGEFKYNEAKIHMPPAFVGVSDGVIEEVTSYPQLIKLGYDVATKEEVRTGLWNSVKNISLESIKNAAVDFYEQKKANYTSDKSYIVNHTVGKDGVELASILMGTGGIKKAVKNVDEGVEKTGKKIKEAIKNKLDDIEKEFLTNTFKNLLTNKFKNYKGLLSFEDWSKRYKTLYKNRKIGKLTEDEFQLLEGGLKPKKGITTSDGKRYFDNVSDGTAREVKSGPITLSNSKQQILKDIEILNQNLTNNQISKIEWHCFDEVNEIEINKFIQDNLRQELKNTEVFKIIKY